MNSKLLLSTFMVLALLLLTPFAGYSQQANKLINIQGTIYTADGLPAAGVTVKLAPGGRATASNDDGYFSFLNIRQGNYTLSASAIGVKPVTLEIIAAANNNPNHRIVLQQTASQLQEVIITGLSSKRLTNKESEYVARMPIKNLENSQSYSVVGQELFNQQVIVDFKESMRNVPGMVPNNNPAGGVGAVLRGFGVTTTFRNGMAVQVYQSDPINIERVEVIKGPSGTLFGAGSVSFGGIINQVTKKPTATPFTLLGFTGGNHQLYRITADV